MTATIQKNVGSPRTISGVQKVRKIVAVGLVVDDAGKYSVIISYQESETDNGAAQVGLPVSLTKVIDDATLPNGAKTEIDSIFVRALAAI